MDRQWLRIPDAAAYLGTTERHVRSLVASGHLAHYKLGGKVVLTAEDCDRFLEAARVEAKAS